MRLTGQFEEGQQFSAHLVVGPKKVKLSILTYPIGVGETDRAV